MNKLIVAFALLEGALVAQVVPNYLDLSFGYRNDNITPNRIEAYDRAGALVIADDIQIKNVNVYEIGAKVRYEPFCNLFGKGNCYIGFINGGSYHESDDVFGTSFDIKSNVNEGKTVDWDLAGGYQFSYGGFVGIAPIFGWSYNKQQIKLKEPKNFSLPDPALNGLKYTTYWNGPFFGVDVFTKFYDFLINVGYEYHWAHWKGNYLLQGPSLHGLQFTNTRRSHNADGNVFYLEALWNIFCGGSIGLSYKYEDFSTSGGDWSIDNNSFRSAGFPDVNKTNVPRASWTSHAVILDLRYSFTCIPIW